MRDGYLNKCKICTREDSMRNRINNIEYYRNYDRGRGNRQGYEYTKCYRELNPIKYKAHSEVNKAMIKGQLKKQPCEVCNKKERIVAHHSDYSRPLDVTWLCEVHHKEWHKINGPGLNG